jgi:hypothetical protein
VSFSSHASDEFWELYHSLPLDIRRQADKQFTLFRHNPSHPSLRLKQVGQLWTARISRSYRAVAFREGASFYWFWIGSHDDYEILLKRVE